MAGKHLAVILAAGAGTRLREVTNKPKCLLELGGCTLLDYQLAALRANDIEEVLVVTGYGAEHIRERYAGRVRAIHDPEYETTNNLHSLWTARQEVAGRDFLCLHSDVLFHSHVLRSCLESSSDVTLILDPVLIEETMKAQIKDGRVVAVGKNIPREAQFGTFLGIARFRPSASVVLPEVLDALVREPERRQCYFTACLPELAARELQVGYTLTDGLPWIEIDVAADLRRADGLLPSLLVEDMGIGPGDGEQE